MSALRRLAALACLLAATLGARGLTPHVTPAAHPKRLGADVVLARYAGALANVGRPHAVAFEYAVEQFGPRNLEQTHRVYRSGLDERDETLSVDGYTLGRPSVRILLNRTYRYDIATVAPRPADYAFTFVDAQPAGGRYQYRFKTEPHAAASFVVNEVAIDGQSFLPSVVRFSTAGGGVRGTGQLVYGKAERYWVVREASVNARLTNGSEARERIVWSKYRFPVDLPPSTFEAPRPLSTVNSSAL